ncbi:KilA-N domain-containing protein [Stutzerimonas chloritidismutans]
MTTALITREYNGNVFHFREDGYFNMTKAAKAFGREARFFMALDSTQAYLKAMEKTVGKSHSLVETSMGRNGGTWATQSSPWCSHAGWMLSSLCSATWSSTTSSTRRPSWSSPSQPSLP